MSAAQRLAAFDELDARELCERAASALTTLVSVINEETTLLRAGRVTDAAGLTGRKAELAQDYVGWARAVQRQAERLGREAPEAVATLRQLHESLATQLADNLRVIATAKSVSEGLIGEVARAVAGEDRPRTYGAGGVMNAPRGEPARGLTVNRAL